jgi:hypothetical protein
MLGANRERLRSRGPCRAARSADPTPAPLRPTGDQATWIAHRDRIGKIVDAYLRTHPTPAMRDAVEQIEDGPRAGDRGCRLT